MVESKSYNRTGIIYSAIEDYEDYDVIPPTHTVYRDSSGIERKVPYNKCSFDKHALLEVATDYINHERSDIDALEAWVLNPSNQPSDPTLIPIIITLLDSSYILEQSKEIAIEQLITCCTDGNDTPYKLIIMRLQLSKYNSLAIFEHLKEYTDNYITTLLRSINAEAPPNNINFILYGINEQQSSSSSVASEQEKNIGFDTCLINHLYDVMFVELCSYGFMASPDTPENDRKIVCECPIFSEIKQSHTQITESDHKQELVSTTEKLMALLYHYDESNNSLTHYNSMPKGLRFHPITATAEKFNSLSSQILTKPGISFEKLFKVLRSAEPNINEIDSDTCILFYINLPKNMCITQRETLRQYLNLALKNCQSLSSRCLIIRLIAKLDEIETNTVNQTQLTLDNADEIASNITCKKAATAFLHKFSSMFQDETLDAKYATKVIEQLPYDILVDINPCGLHPCVCLATLPLLLGVKPLPAKTINFIIKHKLNESTIKANQAFTLEVINTLISTAMSEGEHCNTLTCIYSALLILNTMSEFEDATSKQYLNQALDKINHRELSTLSTKQLSQLFSSLLLTLLNKSLTMPNDLHLALTIFETLEKRKIKLNTPDLLTKIFNSLVNSTDNKVKFIYLPKIVLYDSSDLALLDRYTEFLINLIRKTEDTNDIENIKTSSPESFNLDKNTINPYIHLIDILTITDQISEEQLTQAISSIPEHLFSHINIASIPLISKTVHLLLLNKYVDSSSSTTDIVKSISDSDALKSNPKFYKSIITQVIVQCLKQDVPEEAQTLIIYLNIFKKWHPNDIEYLFTLCATVSSGCSSFLMFLYDKYISYCGFDKIHCVENSRGSTEILTPVYALLKYQHYALAKKIIAHNPNTIFQLNINSTGCIVSLFDYLEVEMKKKIDLIRENKPTSAELVLIEDEFKSLSAELDQHKDKFKSYANSMQYVNNTVKIFVKLSSNPSLLHYYLSPDDKGSTIPQNFVKNVLDFYCRLIKLSTSSSYTLKSLQSIISNELFIQAVSAEPCKALFTTFIYDINQHHILLELRKSRVSSDLYEMVNERIDKLYTDSCSAAQALYNNNFESFSQLIMSVDVNLSLKEFSGLSLLQLSISNELKNGNYPAFKSLPNWLDINKVKTFSSVKKKIVEYPTCSKIVWILKDELGLESSIRTQVTIPHHRDIYNFFDLIMRIPNVNLDILNHSDVVPQPLYLALFRLDQELLDTLLKKHNIPTARLVFPSFFREDFDIPLHELSSELLCFCRALNATFINGGAQEVTENNSTEEDGAQEVTENNSTEEDGAQKFADDNSTEEDGRFRLKLFRDALAINRKLTLRVADYPLAFAKKRNASPSLPQLMLKI